MSMMKRFAEDVAASMGKEEIDLEVLQEAQRRLEATLKDMMVDPPLAVIENGMVKFIRPVGLDRSDHES